MQLNLLEDVSAISDQGNAERLRAVPTYQSGRNIKDCRVSVKRNEERALSHPVAGGGFDHPIRFLDPLTGQFHF